MLPCFADALHKKGQTFFIDNALLTQQNWESQKPIPFT